MAMPFCNASLTIDARISDIISHLSVKDKIQLMNQNGPPLPQLGLPLYHWWEEATHGISPPRNSAETPYETNFAFPITTAMSFNRTMWKKTGEQIAREARAFMNAGNEYSTFWAPVVNLAREPRWGRNVETPGEDPYLSGEYATNFVQGFQEAPEDPSHVMASACCKHYVANEMEHSNVDGYQNDRYHFDADVPMQDLVDSYMVPFQACVEKGKVTSLMCSYNAVNGMPSCANDWLLQTVARDSWGFDGAIVSDCDADSDVFNSHHFTKTPEESVRDVLRAGTDVDCGSFVTDHAQSALDKGVITEADLDERLRYQFRLRMRLGHFDPEGPLDRIEPSVVCSDYANDLMRDGMAQSATLLKNDGSTLPLVASKVASVAVIGPNANLSTSIASYYGGGKPCGMKFWTLADSVKEYVTNTKMFLGVKDVSCSDDPDSSAVDAAKAADTVILGIGTDLSSAAEGHDALGISLSEGQTKLVEAVAAAAKKPIIVVMLTAVPLDISGILANPKVGAVVHAGQPSVAVVGLGDVLFGKKSPAGRMVQTVYPKSYADQISIFDFKMRPGPSSWPRPDCAAPFKNCPNGTNPGRTHRFYTGKPVVPFGFGLSYTKFTYQVVSAPESFVSLAPLEMLVQNARSQGKHFLKQEELTSAGPAATYVVNVTNTGSVDADDVVLGFLVPPGAGSNGVPLQIIFGFERVHVKAGETVSVFLYPALSDFAQVDKEGYRSALPGEYKVCFGVQEAAAKGMGYAEIVTNAQSSVEVVV
jgi:beta-glucosidase-like glycosyl hydrolase